jgi:hypothetical protein
MPLAGKGIPAWVEMKSPDLAAVLVSGTDERRSLTGIERAETVCRR